MRDRSALRVAAAIGCILLTYACTPVRGKGTSAESKPHNAGKSGASSEAGSGGSEAGAEATNTSGPRAGSAGDAPEPGGSGGAPNPGTENSAGKAGSTASQAGSGAVAAAGSGGAAGAAVPASGPVRGVLMDARRRPLPNVALRIGDQSVTTDGLGKFSIDNVAASYAVSFKLDTLVDQTPTTYAWRFEGLTRRDPTLQVYPASEQQLAGLIWHTQGATFPLSDTQRMLAGFASPDGDFTVGVNTADYDSPLVYWSGPETTVGVTHGLLYTVSGAEELPLEYLAHDSKPVTLTVGGDAEATFDFANTKPPAGAVTGRVNAAGQGERENWVVLRFSDGTQLNIADDSSSADAFSYLVPTITNATAAIVALQGRYDQYPRAVAFADNLSANQTGVQIDIPLASTLSAPGDGTMGVDAMTSFQWAGSAKVFVFVAKAKQGYDAMYVVTAATETHLPIGEATLYTPPAGVQFEWHVETHGAYASVDDAAGGEGLISAFFDGHLHGPKRGAGSFTASALRTFVTSP
jgi:hypothetical protein